MKRTLVFMKQVHSSNIKNVDDTLADGTRHIIEGFDGIVTSRNDLVLAAYGADCATIAFWDKKKIGICHAGWRGLVDGLVEKMLGNFEQPQCYLGPVLRNFEITKDDCYDRIFNKFGGLYLHEEKEKITFNFHCALLDVLDGSLHGSDSRCTSEHLKLASARLRPEPKPFAHNKLAIWRNDKGIAETRFFMPGQKVIIE